MMRIRKVLSVLLVLCLVCTMLPVYAAETPGSAAAAEEALSVTSSAGMPDNTGLLDSEAEREEEFPGVLSPVEIDTGEEAGEPRPVLPDGGEPTLFDGSKAPDDNETEVDETGAAVEGSDTAPEGPSDSALFDGVPGYELEGTSSIVPEDGTGLDGSADVSWEDLIGSFDSPEESGGIAGAGSGDGGMDSGTGESVGEPDGGEAEWELPALTAEDETDPVEPGDLPAEDRDPGASSGDGLDGGSAPGGYYFEISSNRCKAGSYITFYTKFTNTTLAFLVVKDRSSGRAVNYRINSNVRYRLNFSGTGSYALYLRLYNLYGMYDGSRHNGTLYVKSGQAPRAYWMSLSSASVAVNQVLTVKTDRKNADKATLIVKNSSGATVYSGTVGSTFQCRFTGAGRYSFHLVTENEFGTYDGSQYGGMTLYCTVTGAPSAYSWSLTGSNRLAPNGSTTIRIDALGGAAKATVIMERSGTVVARSTLTGPTTIRVTPGSPGVYTLYMITQNSAGTYNGKTRKQTISLTVSGSPSDYWMSVSKTECYVGEQLTFSIDPRDSSYFYFAMEKDGRLIYKKNHGLARGITFTPSEPGTYRFYLITYNDFGSFNGGTHNGYSLTCTVKAKQQQQRSTFYAGRDGYSFSNSGSNLGYRWDSNSRTYLDKISLNSYQAVFGNSKGLRMWQASGTWGGSCFGFANTAAWAYQHPEARFSSRFGGSTMNGISAPRSRTSAVTTTLERYQISFSLDSVWRENANNQNNASGLVDAVENVEQGGRMVVLSVYRSIPGGLSGHAVVPYEHHMSGSTHVFTLYDCNHPNQARELRMTTNANGSLRSFSYVGDTNVVYNHMFYFSYADTVRNALPSSARDGAAQDGSQELMVILSGGPDTVSCLNSAGQSVDLAEHEVYLCDSNMQGHLYYLPNGSYTVTCTSNDSRQYVCSVANSATSARATATGNRVIFSIGEADGSIQCSAKSDSAGEMHMSLVNDAGQISYLDADGMYLGAILDSAGSLQASSDRQQVEHNGELLDLSWSGGSSGDLDGAGGAATVETDAFLDGAAGSWSIKSTTSARLSMTEDGIVGTLTLITENPGEMSEQELLVEAFDVDGNCVGTQTVQTVIGAGRSAAQLQLTGAIAPQQLSSGRLKFKVSLPDGEAGGETEAVFENVVLTSSTFDGALSEPLSIAGTDSIDLTMAENGITGTFTLATSNPGAAVQQDIYVAAYDSSGRMLGVEKTGMRVRTGAGTAIVTLSGSIRPERNVSGALTFKVFLTGKTLDPLCAAAVFPNVKVDGIA